MRRVPTTAFSFLGPPRQLCRTTVAFVSSNIKYATPNTALKSAPLLKVRSSRPVICRSLATDGLPSHLKISLPALSPTMENGTIITWHKKEGDVVEEGDLLCDIETDKATMGFETPDVGYLAKILIAEGTRDVPIGKLICVIVSNKEDVAAFASFKSDDVPKTAAAAAPISAKPAPAPEKKPAKTGHAVAFANPDLMGPAVRLMLHHYGLKESELNHSGPKQNILKSDVLDFVQQKGLKPVTQKAKAPAPPLSSTPTTAKPTGSVRNVEKYTDIPLTNIRAVIAKRLLQSKQTIPHEYMSIDLVTDRINALRKDLKSKGTPASINDFLIKACALALKSVPAINVQWRDQGIVPMPTVDISVAVATPSGLITPIVFNANSLGVVSISAKVRDLAKRAKENKLALHEFQGGTFTISNLGMFGSVDAFTAIINPPQAAILAVGGARADLTPSLDVESKCTVTLCYDARAVDADAAAQFLTHLANCFADPELMLLQPLTSEIDFDYSRLL